MNKEILDKCLHRYFEKMGLEPISVEEDLHEREERKKFFQHYSANDIMNFSEEELCEYLSKLWAMQIWGNKQYIVNKYISDNGFKRLKESISGLLYGDREIQARWDDFKENIKGFGPAMMSELLCHVHPNECMVWNNTAVKAYQNLQIPTPVYNYQLNGNKYLELTKYAIEIKEIIAEEFGKNEDLLFVDYFFYDQLRDDVNGEGVVDAKEEIKTSNKSYHNEIVDYIKDIGKLLGYNADATCAIGDSGKKADAAWEFNVGNLGKIRYVFEVQDKGSVDSLLISLENASQDASTQAVVAVSDEKQIEVTKRHAKNISGAFNGKMRYWDIAEIEKVHRQLEDSMSSINRALGNDG